MSEREELYREYCAYMCGSTVFKDELFEKIWQAARRTVSGQEASPIYQARSLKEEEGRFRDYSKCAFDSLHPWIFEKRTVFAAPIPATEPK